MTERQSPLVAKRAFAPHFEFKRLELTCHSCGWAGHGADCTPGESHSGSQIDDHDCPQCGEWIGYSTWPTLDDMHRNWATLKPVEREYAFMIEREQETADGREPAT